jgi:hypothetical protein
MSASTTRNPSALSNAKSYILPVLIVIAGMMFAMGNLFASNAAPLPTQTHTSTMVSVEYHSSGSVTGGALGR